MTVSDLRECVKTFTVAVIRSSGLLTNIGNGGITYSKPIPGDAHNGVHRIHQWYLGKGFVMAGRTMSHGAYGFVEHRDSKTVENFTHWNSIPTQAKYC